MVAGGGGGTAAPVPQAWCTLRTGGCGWLHPGSKPAASMRPWPGPGTAQDLERRAGRSCWHQGKAPPELPAKLGHAQNPRGAAGTCACSPRAPAPLPQPWQRCPLLCGARRPDPALSSQPWRVGAPGCWRLLPGSRPAKPMACFIRRMRKCRQKETNSCLLLPCIPGHHMPPASAPQTAARCSWSGMGTPGGTLQASPGPRGEAKARVALPGSGTPRQPVGSSGCHPLPHQPLCALPPPASPHGCRGAPHPQLPTRAPSSPRPHPHHPSPNPPRLTVPSSPPPSHPRGPAAPPPMGTSRIPPGRPNRARPCTWSRCVCSR